MGEHTIGLHRYKTMDYKGQYKRILYQPGKVTRIIMNRPKCLNALSHPMLNEIEDAFNVAAADPECRVIVLSGAGKSFSCGDDTIGLTPESPPMLADERTPEELMETYGSEAVVWRYFQDEHYSLVYQMHGRLRLIMKPTIAMVHGYAIFNAFKLAVSMDLIFASEDALFLSLIGEAQWDLGTRKMLELAYEHRFLTAREAYEYHLVNRVYSNFETLERETLAFAERVAEQPPSVLRAAKYEVSRIADIQGYSTAFWSDMMERGAYGGRYRTAPIRDADEDEIRRNRFEGKAMARTPRALQALKAKLEGEGKEVPENVAAAIARAAARDDRKSWEKSLKQSWREKGRAERFENQAKAYDERVAKEKKEKEKG